MKRSYYNNSIEKFLVDSENQILAELVRSHDFALEDLQRNAWLAQIRLLKTNLRVYPKGHIFFEFGIPRMGKRVDVILILSGLILVVEFKVGDKTYSSKAIEQVLDYALDLKNFHEGSHNRIIIPILISTEANEVDNSFNIFEDKIVHPLKVNKSNINQNIISILARYSDSEINAYYWAKSPYKPTPTIIEAAQALYQGHSVNEISRSDASAYNLASTSDAISNIIEVSKTKKKKSICFITGVPGSGKTLAGLNIANQRQNIDEGEHAVFLSGNGPLVKVLREALARNEVENNPDSNMKNARQKASLFIQNIHHFRDEALITNNPPVEKVVVFDEAQRAWTEEQTSNFMSRKRGILNFKQSEAEFLISVMDRHDDWAVIICLVGGGQEINTGEAGLPQWFNELAEEFPNWNVYVSNQLSDTEYSWGSEIFPHCLQDRLIFISDLHLGVSVRSFRSEKVSEFVKAILDNDLNKARMLYQAICPRYPIIITRDLIKAKEWLKEKSRGTERIGILASSGSFRLRPFGLFNKLRITPENWFLNSNDDVRSSNYLEELATEFDIQGLELDWTCVAWDANFRFSAEGWVYKKFHGSEWININDPIKQQYLKNAYRVLLTRARQGMVIFVPCGNAEDHTRKEEYYDGIYNYLLEIGIKEI